ncbi:MAG: hypothetical protein IKP37_04520 [Paludibacteraceae bacterium]|nr:hypothetical protein [Paludibacteraceae bacterium]
MKQIKYKDQLTIGVNTVIVLFEKKDVKYIGISDKCETGNDILISVECSDAFFYSAIANSKITMNDTVSEDTVNNIVDEGSNDPVEFESVRKLFPEISLFQLKDCPCENHIKEYAAINLILLNGKNFLEFKTNTKKLIYEIISDCEENVIQYDDILTACTQYNWKFCFLSLYRCIEPFFTIVWTQKMYEKCEKYKEEDDYGDFWEELKDITKKNKESESFQFMIEGGNEYKKNIYKLRNSIVHNKLEEQNHSLDYEKFDADCWDEYVKETLNLIKSLYDNYTDQYNKLQEHIRK